jgi:hypothetical protein
MNRICVWQVGQRGIGKYRNAGDMKSVSVPRDMDAALKYLFEENEVDFDERINKFLKQYLKGFKKRIGRKRKLGEIVTNQKSVFSKFMIRTKSQGYKKCQSL